MKVAFVLVLFTVMVYNALANATNGVCDATLRGFLKQPEGAAICTLCKDVVRLAYRFSNNEHTRTMWPNIFSQQACSLETDRKGDCEAFSKSLINKKASFFQSNAAIVTANATEWNNVLDKVSTEMCLHMSCCEAVYPSTTTTKTAAKPVKASFLEFNAAPAAKPAATPAPKPAATPTPKPATKPAPKPAAKPAPKPAPANKTTPKPAAKKPAVKPAAKKTTPKPAAKKPATANKTTPKPAAKNATKKVAKKNATKKSNKDNKKAVKKTKKNSPALAPRPKPLKPIPGKKNKKARKQKKSKKGKKNGKKRVNRSEINIAQLRNSVDAGRALVEREKLRLQMRAEALEESRKKFNEERNQVESIRQKLQLLYLQNAEAKKVVTAKADVLRNQELAQRKKQNMLKKLQKRLSQQEKSQIDLQRKLQEEKDRLKKAQEMIKSESARLKAEMKKAKEKAAEAERLRMQAEADKKALAEAKTAFATTAAELKKITLAAPVPAQK